MSNRPCKTPSSLSDAVRAAYRAGQEDEALEPIVAVDGHGAPIGRIRPGDYVIFYDLRGEREVELTQSFTEPDFAHFPVERGEPTRFVTLIQYDARLDARVAFPPPGEIMETLSEMLSAHGLRQAKVAESEKAIHLGYFFNGKKREPAPGEERITVPSPHGVTNYALVPELSASQVADATAEALAAGKYDLIVTNFANVDVVGHIEDRAAVIRAVETVDRQIGRVVEAAAQAGYTAIVTADHGTVEKWLYPDGAVDTGHTNSPVPFVLLADRDAALRLRSGGSLCDIAPTILELLCLPKPPAMTGESLLVERDSAWLVRPRKVLLVIADGWGWQEPGPGNLISQAQTPVMDALERQYPFTLLAASGEAVGMPEGSVGNSEAGHLHIGTGRAILSDRLRVDVALRDGSFNRNEAFLWAMRSAKAEGKRLHLLGIVSFYSSHGAMEHLLGLMRLAKQEGLSEVYIHGMLGRRGEQPESGANYVALAESEAAKLGVGQVVSVIGRFWSLDREYNWDRIAKTYDMLVRGAGAPVCVA